MLSYSRSKQDRKKIHYASLKHLVSKKQNDLNLDLFNVFHKTAIGSELEGEDIDKSKNAGILMYVQTMIGFSAYYNNQYVLTDSIYKILLEF